MGILPSHRKARTITAQHGRIAAIGRVLDFHPCLLHADAGERPPSRRHHLPGLHAHSDKRRHGRGWSRSGSAAAMQMPDGHARPASMRAIARQPRRCSSQRHAYTIL
ncbi:hypothetical protein XHC_1777 [Xanthomonas hortorum pv. carotae str. M081]|nr:hypothetical protein XHC_1777 [Xanthomonas hortorum pv. carotae str. M081]